MATTFADLTEHTGTLIALIGALFTVCGILVAVVWRVVFNVGVTLKKDIFDMMIHQDDRIDRIEERQIDLRQRLPLEFVRFDGIGFKTLAEGIGRVENKFDRFVDDCREGKCGVKVIAIKKLEDKL